MIKKLLSFFRSDTQSEGSEYNPKKINLILNRVESLTGSKPNQEQYYLKAFTHRSFLERTKGQIKSNERLEFLGDSILGKIVAEFLFKEYDFEDEGFLTKARSHLVNKHSLEKIAFRLELDDLMIVNDRYLARDKKKLSNLVGDCLEALIAAIYLDLGEATATEFVKKYIIYPQVESGDINSDRNYKGQLLEFSHAQKLNQPVYRIIDQKGPQHDKIYTIEVNVNDSISGVGVGPNKKIAEQSAAKQALKIISELEKNNS